MQVYLYRIVDFRGVSYKKDPFKVPIIPAGGRGGVACLFPSWSCNFEYLEQIYQKFPNDSFKYTKNIKKGV